MEVNVIKISEDEELIFHTRLFGLLEIAYSTKEWPMFVAFCWRDKLMFHKTEGFIELT